MSEESLGTHPRSALRWAIVFFLAHLFLYGMTLCPHPFPDYDAAELAACTADGGLPHPGGYPLWHALARGINALDLTTPATVANGLSALFGALAGTLFFMVLHTLLRHRGAALFGALILTTSPQFWRLSTVAEVYTLHLTLCCLLLYAALKWQRTRKRTWAVLAALTMGLGLSNHATFIFLVPGLICFLIVSRALPSKTLCVGLLFLALLPPSILFGWYLPSVARGPTPGFWITLFDLNDGMTLEQAFHYATGRIYAANLWHHSRVGDGLSTQLLFLDTQLEALPQIPFPSDILAIDVAVWLAGRLILIAAFVGAVFHVKGELPTFLLVASWAGFVALFYAGQCPVAIPDLASMALPLLIPTILWTTTTIKGLILLARDRIIPLRANALVLFALLIAVGRLSHTFYERDLSSWDGHEAYVQELTASIPDGGTALITDYQTANLLRYEAAVSPSSPAAGMTILPFGVVSTSFRSTYGVECSAELDAQWRILVRWLMKTHDGHVETTLMNVRALQAFDLEPRILSQKALSFRIVEPPPLSFVPPDSTTENDADVVFGDRLALTHVDSPSMPVSAGSLVRFELTWHRLVPAPKLKDLSLIVRFVRQGATTPRRISSTEGTGDIVWSLGRHHDLTESWTDDLRLKETRSIFIPPRDSPLEMPPGDYNVLLAVWSGTNKPYPISSVRGMPSFRSIWHKAAILTVE